MTVPQTTRPQRGLTSRSFSSRALLALSMVSIVGCDSCKKEKAQPDPIGVPAPPRVTTQQEIGTEIGNGRVLDTPGTEISTSMRWTRQFTDKDTAILAGDVEGEACAIVSTDGGRSFSPYCTKVDSPILTWSVGEDGTAVLTAARRQIPKTAPKGGALPPIDTLSFFYAAPGQKLSAPASLLAPDEKNATPLIPRGTAMAAVFGPSSASVVVELRPKMFAVAFSAGPGEGLPAPIELPKGEDPVMAPYGRAPQLLTVSKNKLWVRPWPKPGGAFTEPKPVERVGITKVLLDDLSMGPECESGAWSFRRVIQPPNKTFMLGVSPAKTVFFELPETTVASSPIACSSDRVVVEAINPVDKLPSLVVCTIEGACLPPENRPFLKPWPEAHERKIAYAPSTKGVVAVQELKTKIKWALYASESVDGGKLYNLERRFGGGEGNAQDGYQLGALMNLGSRDLLLISARVKGTTRRSWYLLASDDAGLSWVPP